MPQVSVILSVYNGEKYLRQAIDSVLAQSFTDFELWLVDDGSTDNSWCVIQSYSDPRIRPLQQENQGVAAAKNAALFGASGRYTAIIDADDWWAPDKLEKQVSLMESDPGITVSGTFVQVVDESGAPLYMEKKQCDPGLIKAGLKHKNQFTHSSVIFRTELAKQCGGYYEKARQYLVDYKLLYQLDALGNSTHIPEALTYYRIVPGSLSTKNDPPRFHEIVHNTLQRGHILDEELEELRQMKAREKRHPAVRKAGYHYYLGRVFLFYNFNRSRALKHFLRALAIWPWHIRSWIYAGMALLWPQRLIQWFYRRYFANSEYML